MGTEFVCYITKFLPQEMRRNQQEKKSFLTCDLKDLHPVLALLNWGRVEGRDFSSEVERGGGEQRQRNTHAKAQLAEHLEESLVTSCIYLYLSLSFLPFWNASFYFFFVILSQFPQEKNATEVLTELNNITTPQDHKTLSETVLMTSLHTLLRLVGFEKGNNTSHTSTASSEMNFTSVYMIASNLLDSANKATWREIDSKVRTECKPSS